MQQTKEAGPQRFWRPGAELPQVPAKWWEALLIGLLAPFIFAALGTVAAVAAFMATGGTVNVDTAPPLTVILLGSIGGQVLTLGAILGYVALRGKQSPFPALGFRRVNTGLALKALGIAILAMAALQLLASLLPQEWIQPNAIIEDISNGTAVQVILAVLFACVLAPVVEEIVLRGYAFSALDGRFGFVPAALISSAAFGILHLQSISLVLSTFVIGLVFCWVYKKTGSLWVNIVLHALYNTFGVIIALTVL